MKKVLMTVVMAVGICCSAIAQERVFEGKIDNPEYEVYIVMDFYNKNILIKGAEFMGEMPGYLGDTKDSRKWLIVECDVKKENMAILTIINEEGSEDLTAEMKFNKADGTYTLTQKTGSSLKIARNKKWKKLPGTMAFMK